MNNLNCGGAEKALVSLLQELDYSKYDVDLFLFKHEGLFLPHLPKEVNLLPEPNEYKYFDMPIGKSLIGALSGLRFDIFFARLMMVLIRTSEKSPSIREQKLWKHLRYCLPRNKKQYDLAVGYLQRMPNYYCIDKITAIKKAGFIHNDYDKLDMDPEIDRPYLQKFDKIFTVSDSCKEILYRIFPELANKIHVMFNIVSAESIAKLASENIAFPSDAKIIVTVGRLSPQKGYEIAIDACKILIDRGINVFWYVLGEGDERKKLENLIARNKLQNNFVLKGIIENPYPYMKFADIYVQTSRFEGKSIAIDEAKILRKPIVVTNFETAKDQIINGHNGMITEMNAEAVAETIDNVLHDNELRNLLAENLANEIHENANELAKLLILANTNEKS